MLAVDSEDAFKALDTGANLLLTGEAGSGKAQPLDAKILSPTGWIVFPQGEKPIFRVSFTDESFTETCDEHLWYTFTSLEWRFDWKLRNIYYNR